MSVERKDFFVPSCDGIHTLSGVVFLPDGEVKGYFHVVHGMTEYIGRYERFLRDVAEKGWIAFGYDHLGHGKSVSDDSELGFIAEKNGWDLLARDVKTFSDAVRVEFGDDDARPYCLMGHSMGSFIVRLAATKYVKPQRLIVMGTGGSNPLASVGILLSGAVKLFCGARHVSSLVNNLAFGDYNKRFSNEEAEAPDPWLTTDIEVRKKYQNDPYCNFSFTVSAMGDLIRLTKYSNSAEWYRSFPKDLPVLLVAGENDPVGNYGKGVREVEERLLAVGVQCKCILYSGARHEILNDFTYENVKCDILDFCMSEQ